jgi:hypothetical protein
MLTETSKTQGNSQKFGGISQGVPGKAHVALPHHVSALSFSKCFASLCALVPPPRYPLTQFHGVLAPRAKLRSLIVPLLPAAPAAPTAAKAAKAERACKDLSKIAEERSARREARRGPGP